MSKQAVMRLWITRSQVTAACRCIIPRIKHKRWSVYHGSKTKSVYTAFPYPMSTLPKFFPSVRELTSWQSAAPHGSTSIVLLARAAEELASRRRARLGLV